jgi:hypothetical protein
VFNVLVDGLYESPDVLVLISAELPEETNVG